MFGKPPSHEQIVQAPKPVERLDVGFGHDAHAERIRADTRADLLDPGLPTRGWAIDFEEGIEGRA